MGKKNYLIEGVSASGKTTICNELNQLGYLAIHGDRELAYQGDPLTGQPLSGEGHIHHIWNVEQVKSIIADDSNELTFFCGGSRNYNHFLHLFDEVFVLDIDLETLLFRLDKRPSTEWGGLQEHKDLIIELFHSKKDIPKNAIVINSTQFVSIVVQDILKFVHK